MGQKEKKVRAAITISRLCYVLIIHCFSHLAKAAKIHSFASGLGVEVLQHEVMYTDIFCSNILSHKIKQHSIPVEGSTVIISSW